MLSLAHETISLSRSGDLHVWNTHNFLIIGTLLCWQTIAAAATPDNLNDVRRFLTATYPSDRPGAAVVVMEKGELVHRLNLATDSILTIP